MAASIHRHVRNLAIAGLALGVVATAPVRASDPAEARNVIQSMWDAVIPVLASKGMDKNAREARFAAIYRMSFDNAGIGAAVAGQAWLQASPAQRDAFLAQFETYVIKVYAGQFAGYNGEKLIVTGSEADGPGAMVSSQISDAESKRLIGIKWRLRPTASGLKVRDVVVENISMTLNQRREFAAVMRQGDGTLDGLTAALRTKIAEIDRKQ